MQQEPINSSFFEIIIAVSGVEEVRIIHVLHAAKFNFIVQIRRILGR